MAQSPKKKQENTYLLDLLAQHRSSAQLINGALLEKEQEYEQKIKEGQYEIRKVSFSMGQSTLDRKSLEKYRNNRAQISTQLSTISKTLKEDDKNQMMLSDEERKKFVKQMIFEQKKLNKQKEEKIRAEQLRKLQIQEVKKKIQENEAKERMESKRREIQRRLSQLSEEKDRRDEEIRYRNREYKQVASQKLLMHRMLQSYNKFQNATLQEKKKKLASIRQIHKPISKQEFEEHLEKIKYCKEITEQQKEMKSPSRISESNVDFYKSKWYRNVSKEEKIDENKVAEEQRKLIQESKDKSKKYSQYIRQNFVPESDDKLTEEIAKRQPEPIKRKKPKQIRQMGINNLQYSKEKVLSKEDIEEKLKQKLKTSERSQPKPKNYLEELRANRRNISLNEKFMQNAVRSPAQAEKVKIYANSLEQRAKRQQELKKLGKEISEAELDDLYIKALDAKLNLLHKQKI